MRRNIFDRLINENNFSELFITEMGWNNPDSRQSLYIIIDEVEYEFCPVAEKRGFQVYSCEVPVIPVASECKKIDNQLRRYGNDYICVFVQQRTTHHLWLTPVKTNEKRELVKTEYLGAAQADFLFSKVDDLSFDLTEEVWISDVKARVHGSFHLNSERVTKDFYAQFRREHTAFKKHITGIDDDKNRDWYASVMLNRLMFCYFIQKKGFLDMNTNYLQEKLKWVKQQRGEDKFFGTFYKGFLCAMFHEGLNHPSHDNKQFLAVYGRIPYLNGGMFDDHQLERENHGIDIADIAFEQLFNFFDKWNWHLDTRLTASGKDINPDVLGYIFEQYINDRAAMGAYYTKEDITEYIGKNCIIPFLMDKTASATQESAKAFEPEGWIWKSLSQSGGTYIYDAVKKGYSEDWKQRIPDYISQGIDTTEGNLLERRARWNEKTFEDFALPTEIWRETIERLQRCDSLLQKICSGEIHSINDFITYNLDIRQFVEDLIRNTRDHKFVGHFYHSLQNVTILDPTCGSGAFLFAALNILEPLYEACLDRMEEWHKQNANLFVAELEEMTTKYSSNRQYFIYKSIILRNLYGVDIMVEATEIAKLRLFLKMVAVVEVDKRKDNLGLDPLPDIDFNIKCGNTLVGYATEAELKKAVAENSIFAQEEFEPEINRQMLLVSKAYELFRSEQLKAYDNNKTIKETKDQLKERLSMLNEVLNRFMHSCIAYGTPYENWLASHQPFHWLAEFYQIIHGNGGFDVIIGNPPYVEKKKDELKEMMQPQVVVNSGNLYTAIIYRCKIISNSKNSLVGMIVPISFISTSQHKGVRMEMEYKHNSYYSSYDIRPDHLFDGAAQRLTIFIYAPNGDCCYTCKQLRWYTIYRPHLFNTIAYSKVLTGYDKFYRNDNVSAKLIKKVLSRGLYLDGSCEVWTATTANNYIKALSCQPRYFTNGVASKPSGWRIVPLSISDMNTCIAIINSSLFYYLWKSSSDGFNMTKGFVQEMIPILVDDNLNIVSLSRELQKDLELNSKSHIRNQKTTGKTEIQLFLVKPCKPIIDEIDKVLAKHYGFTEEELDFIINYDIKYRMGDELSSEE